MKKKIIGCFICLQLLILIPIAAGTTIQQENHTTQMGWTTLQGIIYGLHEINNGAVIEFKCLFVHYVEQGLGERITGFRYGTQMMAIPGSFRGLLLPHIIVGWCPGALES
jgi:hypothetical protein